MKKVTLKDVAGAAGISIAAVSLILAGKGKISSAQRSRVKILAEELGYRRLASDPTRRAKHFKYVSILQREEFPFLWNFSQPFATWLEERISEKGFYPLIRHVPASTSLRTTLKEITGARVGAVFAIHYAEPELFKELEAAGIPVIIINNSEYQSQFFSVLADEVQGAYEATMRLVGLGHRVIGYADYRRPSYPTLVRDRYFGYRKAIEESGLGGEGEHRITVELPDFDRLLSEVSEIFDGARPPTAFAVHDDYFAAYLIEALKRVGKRVPQEVSVIATGGDVLDYQIPFMPKIDTMQIDRRLMASMAFSLLESRLEQPGGQVRVLKTKMPFVDRGSCLPPPSGGA